MLCTIELFVYSFLFVHGKTIKVNYAKKSSFQSGSGLPSRRKGDVRSLRGGGGGSREAKKHPSGKKHLGNVLKYRNGRRLSQLKYNAICK